MREFLTLVLIFAYPIISFYIGINQYQEFGELSRNYLIFQWIAFALSVFSTLKFQNSQTKIGETLATLGGGFAMMIVIQAVIFYLLGDVITSHMSTFKTIVLVILGIIIIRVVFKYLTRGQRF